jgi:hypothetical protein
VSTARTSLTRNSASKEGGREPEDRRPCLNGEARRQAVDSGRDKETAIYQAL